jgi:hypothetical protein
VDFSDYVVFFCITSSGIFWKKLYSTVIASSCAFCSISSGSFSIGNQPLCFELHDSIHRSISPAFCSDSKSCSLLRAKILIRQKLNISQEKWKWLVIIVKIVSIHFLHLRLLATRHACSQWLHGSWPVLTMLMYLCYWSCQGNTFVCTFKKCWHILYIIYNLVNNSLLTLSGNGEALISTKY